MGFKTFSSLMTLSIALNFYQPAQANKVINDIVEGHNKIDNLRKTEFQENLSGDIYSAGSKARLHLTNYDGQSLKLDQLVNDNQRDLITNFIIGNALGVYISEKDSFTNAEHYTGRARSFGNSINKKLINDENYQFHMAAMAALNIALLYATENKQKNNIYKSNQPKSLFFDIQDWQAKVQKHAKRLIDKLGYQVIDDAVPNKDEFKDNILNKLKSFGNEDYEIIFKFFVKNYLKSMDARNDYKNVTAEVYKDTVQAFVMYNQHDKNLQTVKNYYATPAKDNGGTAVINLPHNDREYIITETDDEAKIINKNGKLSKHVVTHNNVLKKTKQYFEYRGYSSGRPSQFTEIKEEVLSKAYVAVGKKDNNPTSTKLVPENPAFESFKIDQEDHKKYWQSTHSSVNQLTRIIVNSIDGPRSGEINKIKDQQEFSKQKKQYLSKALNSLIKYGLFDSLESKYIKVSVFNKILNKLRQDPPLSLSYIIKVDEKFVEQPNSYINDLVDGILMNIYSTNPNIKQISEIEKITDSKDFDKHKALFMQEVYVYINSYFIMNVKTQLQEQYIINTVYSKILNLIKFQNSTVSKSNLSEKSDNSKSLTLGLSTTGLTTAEPKSVALTAATSAEYDEILANRNTRNNIEQFYNDNEDLVKTKQRFIIDDVNITQNNNIITINHKSDITRFDRLKKEYLKTVTQILKIRTYEHKNADVLKQAIYYSICNKFRQDKPDFIDGVNIDDKFYCKNKFIIEDKVNAILRDINAASGQSLYQINNEQNSETFATKRNKCLQNVGIKIYELMFDSKLTVDEKRQLRKAIYIKIAHQFKNENPDFLNINLLEYDLLYRQQKDLINSKTCALLSNLQSSGIDSIHLINQVKDLNNFNNRKDNFLKKLTLKIYELNWDSKLSLLEEDALRKAIYIKIAHQFKNENPDFLNINLLEYDLLYRQQKDLINSKTCVLLTDLQSSGTDSIHLINQVNDLNNFNNRKDNFLKKLTLKIYELNWDSKLSLLEEDVLSKAIYLKIKNQFKQIKPDFMDINLDDHHKLYCNNKSRIIKDAENIISNLKRDSFNNIYSINKISNDDMNKFEDRKIAYLQEAINEIYKIDFDNKLNLSEENVLRKAIYVKILNRFKQQNLSTLQKPMPLITENFYRTHIKFIKNEQAKIKEYMNNVMLYYKNPRQINLIKDNKHFNDAKKEYLQHVSLQAENIIFNAELTYNEENCLKHLIYKQIEDEFKKINIEVKTNLALNDKPESSSVNYEISGIDNSRAVIKIAERNNLGFQVHPALFDEVTKTKAVGAQVYNSMATGDCGPMVAGLSRQQIINDADAIKKSAQPYLRFLDEQQRDQFFTLLNNLNEDLYTVIDSDVFTIIGLHYQKNFIFWTDGLQNQLSLFPSEFIKKCLNNKIDIYGKKETIHFYTKAGGNGHYNFLIPNHESYAYQRNIAFECEKKYGNPTNYNKNVLVQGTGVADAFGEFQANNLLKEYYTLYNEFMEIHKKYRKDLFANASITEEKKVTSSTSSISNINVKSNESESQFINKVNYVKTIIYFYDQVGIIKIDMANALKNDNIHELPVIEQAVKEFYDSNNKGKDSKNVEEKKLDSSASYSSLRVIPPEQRLQIQKEISGWIDWYNNKNGKTSKEDIKCVFYDTYPDNKCEVDKAIAEYYKS